MISREYSALERRAAEQVWNGAGRYDVKPPFLALEKGEPDLYLNTIIGLSVKWLDEEKMSAFFDSYSGSVREEDCDALVWLALENCLYEKEVKERPILAVLRRSHASAFLASRGSMSRQEQMMTNAKIYEQLEARWCDAAGQKRPALGPGARRLADELKLSGDLDTDGVISALRRILEEIFGLFSSGSSGASRIAVSRRIAGILGKVMNRETHERDSLLIRQSGTGSGAKGPTRELSRGRNTSVTSPEDEDFIKNIFGPCYFTDPEMRVLEDELCTGAHENCRLYIAGSFVPEAGKAKGPDRETERISVGMRAQEERNKKYIEKSGALVESSVRSLAAALDTVLATYAEPLPKKSNRGKLDPSLAYRLPVLHDPDVFTSPGDELEHRIRIDILLDASASRLDYQEVIAAQTHIIVKALEKCRIPARVTAFRSLRGYTVLQILKNYDQSDDSGIMRYFAAGWNRDGLALETAARLIREDREGTGCERILFILTDANPDDSTRMPPEPGKVREREYSGEAAVLDTADTVRSIRESGIHTVAVYLGSTAHVDNVHLIYGSEYTAVREIGGLASHIAALLSRTLTELRN